MKPTIEVSSIINSITDNEDARQDLWVHYLSGTPAERLNSYLNDTQLEYSDDLELRESIWQLMQDPLSEELQSFLEINFSDYERTIICLLMLGLDTGKISAVKGVSEVRIRQSIAAIRYNTSWSTIHGIKKVHKM